MQRKQIDFHVPRRVYAVSRKEAAEEDPQAQAPQDAQEDPLAAQAQIDPLSAFTLEASGIIAFDSEAAWRARQ
jgi:hypothetical protein